MNLNCGDRHGNGHCYPSQSSTQDINLVEWDGKPHTQAQWAIREGGGQSWLTQLFSEVHQQQQPNDISREHFLLFNRNIKL